MNKRKILILFLSISLLVSTDVGFCAVSQNKNSEKPSSKLLKATVEDYRLEYINKDWWDNFNDPVLKGYIIKAVNDNYDLKIASLRVQESRATVEEYLGREFPSIDLNSNFTRNKTSGNIAMANFHPPAYSRNTFYFPLTVNYELDLWLKNRQTTISKKKELEAAQYNEKSTYISLCSLVATTYFNIISTDKQIELQEDIVNLRKNILDMMKENNKYGLSPTTDVIQADRSLTEAEVSLNDLKKRQSILLNQLAILTGDSVSNVDSLKRTSIDKIDLNKNLPASIASEVVQKRPDILQAEAELQKARIDISLARKDFLPSFRILGEFGFNANSLSKVFKWDSYITTIGAGIVESIFTGGQRRARLKARKYQYQEMLANYQKTILLSFQEVNDSLASLKFDTQKDNDNLKRISLEKDNLGLVNNKYALGAISLLDLLQYKERTFSLEKEQIQSKTDCLVDSLSLYKAVGGKL